MLLPLSQPPESLIESQSLAACGLPVWEQGFEGQQALVATF
jgi:hypothetical protein